MDQLRGNLEGEARVELRGSALRVLYRCTTVTRIAMYLPLQDFIRGYEGVINSLSMNIIHSSHHN